MQPICPSLWSLRTSAQKAAVWREVAHAVKSRRGVVIYRRGEAWCCAVSALLLDVWRCSELLGKLLRLCIYLYAAG